MITQRSEMMLIITVCLILLLKVDGKSIYCFLRAKFMYTRVYTPGFEVNLRSSRMEYN